MDSDVLFEIIAAANYMTITPLLNLACLWVTFDMQGKNIDQVRTWSAAIATAAFFATLEDFCKEVTVTSLVLHTSPTRNNVLTLFFFLHLYLFYN